jgi:aspartate aminotransferase-like enzyme
VYLASGVSGKALGGLPGLSMIFHHHPVVPSDRLPRYLDLGLYARLDGVPFTHSSNLLAALRVACEHALRRAPFEEMASLARWLRHELRALGYGILAPERSASPAIVTLLLPDGESAEVLGDRLATGGFELSFRSGYLRKRNWIQISLMGECSRDRIESLLLALRSANRREPRADAARLTLDREIPLRVSSA